MTPPSLSNPLDQERAASMADEGGASGAQMEDQGSGGSRAGLASLHPLPRRAEDRLSLDRPGEIRPPFGWIAGGILLGLTGLGLYRIYRDRGQPAIRPE